MTVRTNLVTNPSAEVDLSGWAVPGTRNNTTTAAIIAGSWCQTRSATIHKTSPITVTAGLPYTASAYLTKATTNSRSVSVTVRFFDSAGVQLEPPVSDVETNADLAASGVPERRSQTRTAPAGTSYAEVWLYFSGAATYFDAVMLEQSATLGEYFDGTTVKAGYAYAWSGTAHASASTETSTATTVAVKSYESGAWVTRTAVPKVYVGGAWIVRRPKRWNGTAWVDLP